MLTEKKILVVNFYIQQADRNFSDSILLFDNSSYNRSLSSLYYCCFYIVTALHISNSIKKVKSHSGLASSFHNNFIKNSKLSENFGKHYSYLFKRRSDADYGELILITIDELEDLIPTTKKFLIEIKKLIKY
jgi:uncharacterized protein (UPF0332 family)